VAIAWFELLIQQMPEYIDRTHEKSQSGYPNKGLLNEGGPSEEKSGILYMYDIWDRNIFLLIFEHRK
jgi:hypothetical protein